MKKKYGRNPSMRRFEMEMHDVEKEALKRIAKDRGTSISSLIRPFIKQIIKHNGSKF